MSENKLTQEDIDRAVRDRLDVVVPVLRLLSREKDEETGRFTDDGLSTIRAAEIVAWDGAMYLAEQILEETTGHHDISLLTDAQSFLAVAALALRGMKPTGSEWMEGPHTVRYLLEQAQALQEHAQAEGVEKSDDVEAVTTTPDDVDVAEIRDAGLLLRDTAESLNQGGAHDAKVDVPLLRRLHEHAVRACDLVWRIESHTPSEQQPEGWPGDLYRHLWTLPGLVMAAELALEKPNAVPFRRGGKGPRWRWCVHFADEVGREMVEWAEEVANA